MIRKNFSVNKWCSRALKFGVVLAIIASLASCNSSNDDEELVGDWVKRSQFEGSKRTDAVGAVVTVDGKEYGFFGLGVDQDKKRLKDCWMYDLQENQWNKIAAEFPGTARNSAVAFEAGGKIYVGTGYDGLVIGEYSADFYEYDPNTDTWTKIADFPGEPRIGAVAFSINGKGYVGMGKDSRNSYKNFYAYDPAGQEWSQVTSYEGDKSADGVAFVINNEAYVCTGMDNGLNNDFFKYNPDNNSWEELAKISDATPESFDDDYDMPRVNAVAFVSGGKGYIVSGGKSPSSAGSDVWEYNPATDRWMEKTSFEGSPRYNAVGFTLGDKGFIVSGQSSTSLYHDDIWRFDPNTQYNQY